MNDQRFEELERKRFQEGLTHEEADEMGRLMAEKEGRPYSNAGDLKHPDALGEDEGPASSQTELEELQEHPDVHGSEERAAS